MRRDFEETVIYNALSQVETPPCDIAGAVARRRAEPARRVTPLRPVRRLTALAAVCIVLALAVGAAAVAGISGAWSYFFAPPPEAVVSPVGVSQTSGDYTLTLEDVIMDQTGAVFLLALSRADGGPVDPEARLECNTMGFDVLIDGEPMTGGMDREPPVLSEDGKRLYFTMEMHNVSLDGEESLLGKTITFRADGVGKVPDELLTGRASLAPLAAVELPRLEGETLPDGTVSLDVPADAAQAVAEQGVDLPLSQDGLFPQYRIVGAWLEGEELAVVVSQDYVPVRSDGLACVGFSVWGLVNGETGVQYPVTGGRGFELADGTWAMAFYCDGAAAGELADLTLSGVYRVDQVLAEGPFSLTFQGEEETGRTLPLSMAMETEDGPVTLTQLRLSGLGLVLDFQGGSLRGADVLKDDPPILHFADGSTMEAPFKLGMGSEGSFALSFAPQDEAGSRIFLDPDQVTHVTYQGVELLLPKASGG